MWGFLPFLFPGIYGHSGSKRLPITKGPKRKRADRKRKSKEDRGKGEEGVSVFNIFFWEATAGLASAQTGSWYTGPQVEKRKLLHFLCRVDFFWLFSLYICLLCCKLLSSDTGERKEISVTKPLPSQSDLRPGTCNKFTSKNAVCPKKMRKTFDANKRLFKRMNLKISR